MQNNLDVKIPEGHTILKNTTKVIALSTGYAGVIREAGDIFTVPAGTLMEPGCWFKPVQENNITTAEFDVFDEMTVAELRVALAEKNIDFQGVTKKGDLINLLAKANAEADLV